MTKAGDARATNEGREIGEKFRINEEHQNICQEAGENSSSGVSEFSTNQGGNIASISATIGMAELEQILKQKTFTRAERQRLIALLHSEESPSDDTRDGASTTSDSHKKHKPGHERDNFLASVIISNVIASPTELAKASYKGSTSSMENLPDEVLSNIFMRLLAKQLAQMRSVSKSWNALLSQSSFIKSHLHHSLLHNDQIFLVLNEEEESELFTTHVCRSHSPELERTNFIKLPTNPPFKYTKGFTVINGLICFSYADSIIQIWNPSLSAVSTLPPSSMPSGDFDSVETYFRFGYDPKTDDYKVVKLTGLIEQPAWLQVEIYSMRRALWELITERIPPHITYICTDDGVCADGHDGYLHWLGYIDGKYIWDRILGFDLGSGTFHEIPLPDAVPHSNPTKHLGVLDGKLCVMSWDENDGICEVWVMEEYGVAESWVKRLVFSKFIGDTYPYGFTSYNELLFENDLSLVLYDPIANKEKFFKDYCPEEYRPQRIVKYVDSLVWMTPVVREMVDGA